MSHGTSSVGRCRHRRAAAFIPCRLVALRPAILSALTWLFLAAPANAQFNREIFDAGDPFQDTTAYMNFYSSVDNYYFGRSEGVPVRGPNPVPGPQYGSTDVDSLYDLVPVIHSYYVDKLGRNGPNGLGGIGNGVGLPFNNYRLFANVNDHLNLAFAGTQSVSFTTGATHNWDLVGHEFNHLQSRYLRQNPDSSFVRLASTGEPAALNEGLADFFGEGFERYVTGTNDWLFTAGTFPDPHADPEGASRNMADPGSLIEGFNNIDTPFPDRYFSPNFYTGTLDNGGAHHNSTVLTHAAYLAVEGGTFRGHTITGLGFDKVEQILERAATVYFQSNETYLDAYGHIIQAATDLYSPDDVNQITQALQSVEMNHVPSLVPGDANDDGFVDGGDYTLWADHYLQTGQTWATGDFNGDGTVDGGDYTIWADNYAPAAGAASAVPEPSTLALAGIGAIALLAYGRRRRFCN